MNHSTGFRLATILARKPAGREEKARLPFAEKIAVVERMRRPLASFNVHWVNVHWVNVHWVNAQRERRQPRRDAVAASA